MRNNLGSNRLILVLVFLSLLAASTMGVWLWKRTPLPSGPLEKITISFPGFLGAAQFFVAQGRGFFRDVGLEIIEQPVLVGKEALNNVLQDKADLAITADLPLIFAVARGEKPIILATMFRDHGGVSVVARRDRGIASPNDLRGKKIGVSFNTSGHFFLDAFLMERQIPVDSITFVDVPFNHTADAIINGDVDAICTWDPALAKLQDTLKERGLTFDTSNQYTFRFQLVTSASYLKNHQKQLRRVLEAFAKADTYLEEHAADARKLVQLGTGMSDAVFKRGFDTAEVGLLLDQNLLLALDDQTRWAMKRGFVKKGPVPNYLDYVSFDALESAKHSAVTVPH